EIRVERATQLIELLLELRDVDVQTARQAEAAEVVHILGDRLDLDALLTEIFAGDLRLAVPAHAAGHLQLGPLRHAPGCVLHDSPSCALQACKQNGHGCCAM